MQKQNAKLIPLVLGMTEKMKSWIRSVLFKQMMTIVCAVVFLSVIDFLFIQPGRYWRGGACAICVYLFRFGDWIPLAIGVLTPLFPRSWHLSPVFIVFEYVFAFIYAAVYAESFLYGIAWVGQRGEGAFVAFFWVFWLTCGIAIGLLIKYWRSAYLSSK